MLHTLEEIRKNESSPEQALKDVFRGYIHYSLAHPEQYKVIFFSNPNLYGRPEEFTSRDTMSLRCWKKVSELFADCMKSGVFRPVDCDILSIVFWSAIHGLISSLIFTKDFPMPDPEVMTEMLLDGLFKGYRP